MLVHALQVMDPNQSKITPVGVENIAVLAIKNAKIKKVKERIAIEMHNVSTAACKVKNAKEINFIYFVNQRGSKKFEPLSVLAASVRRTTRIAL